MHVLSPQTRNRLKGKVKLRPGLIRIPDEKKKALVLFGSERRRTFTISFRATEEIPVGGP